MLARTATRSGLPKVSPRPIRSKDPNIFHTEQGDLRSWDLDFPDRTLCGQKWSSWTSSRIGNPRRRSKSQSNNALKLEPREGGSLLIFSLVCQNVRGYGRVGVKGLPGKRSHPDAQEATPACTSAHSDLAFPEPSNRPVSLTPAPPPRTPTLICNEQTRRCTGTRVFLFHSENYRPVLHGLGDSERNSVYCKIRLFPNALSSNPLVRP